MLATPWDAVFSDEGWVFEMKWDGVRCLLTSEGGHVRLHSRAGNDMTRRYPELAGLELPADVVLDGEIVALDDRGHPSFELLQSRMNVVRQRFEAEAVPVSFVAFDLLHDGQSFVSHTLEERTGRLDELMLPVPIVTGDRFPGHAEPIWDFVVQNDLEGIVAKRQGSRYQSGVRSPAWRKIGNYKQLRAVVGGFTEGSGGRVATFGALVIGLWTDAGLRWIGSVGSGFDDTALQSIRGALDQMTTTVCPFVEKPDLAGATMWIEPRLVTVIRYKQWTSAGRVRAPSFKGFTDTPAPAASWEAEGPSPDSGTPPT